MLLPAFQSENPFPAGGLFRPADAGIRRESPLPAGGCSDILLKFSFAGRERRKKRNG
jgi:hypothetical protein